MVHGEFESMKAIHSLLPDFAPEPIAWGTYQTIPDTHFFLCEFRDMIDDMPDPHKFTVRLAELHQNSSSPTGKFGFHTTTYSGNLPQMTEWEESWETFFAKSMRQALKLELQAKGHNPEFDVLVPILFDKVIPRLLRPLESEGRSVKPSLVHGDLWYANSGVDVDADAPLIFDACCFYAHNECKYSVTQLLQISQLIYFLVLKMSSVNGVQSAIDLGLNTWMHTILMFKFPPLKKITMAVSSSTSCEPSTPPLS
jgi:protein-ribulosamine 3-kinase